MRLKSCRRRGRYQELCSTRRILPWHDAPIDSDPVALIHGLLEGHLANHELAVPLLPEVAVRVVRAGSQGSTNAQQLAEIINADPALTMYVLRIAASAAQRPASPIASLQHAVAWLGFDEVANIAFTLALQGKMLDVKGQQHKARRLWRHSLASALWSRQLAHMLAEEPACATSVGCCTTSARWSPWAPCTSSRSEPARN